MVAYQEPMPTWNGWDEVGWRAGASEDESRARPERRRGDVEPYEEAAGTARSQERIKKQSEKVKAYLEEA